MNGRRCVSCRGGADGKQEPGLPGLRPRQVRQKTEYLIAGPAPRYKIFKEQVLFLRNLCRNLCRCSSCKFFTARVKLDQAGKTGEKAAGEDMTDKTEETKNKKDSGKKKARGYDNERLSAFCLQVSLLLDAAIPLADGLEIMAEDAAEAWEKKLLMDLSDEAAVGTPFADALEKTGAFPHYMIRLSKIGQETGNLDRVMKALSEYYDREAKQAEALKNAVTYPAMLVLMLLVVLYVLFSRVMPVFSDVYEQLGAALSPLTKAAMRFGRTASGVALAAVLVLLVLFGVLYFLSVRGIRPGFVDYLADHIWKNSKTSQAIAKRRFASVLSMTMKSGLPVDRGFSLAEEVVENSGIREQIRKCEGLLDTGENYYDVLKSTGLFSGFHIQMIKVGSRSGHLDTMMDAIAQDYEELSEKAMDRFVSGFEPTVVAILAVCVGLVLLSVMLPLAGLLSSIG